MNATVMKGVSVRDLVTYLVLAASVGSSYALAQSGIARNKEVIVELKKSVEELEDQALKRVRIEVQIESIQREQAAQRRLLEKIDERLRGGR